MIASIRQLARPAFYPQSQQCDVSSWIAVDIDGDSAVDMVRLDLEASPPSLVFENSSQTSLDGTGVTSRAATAAELATILAGLQASPPHPAELTPLEVLARFTDEEQDVIDAGFPRFARLLFAATASVAWATFAEAVGRLQQMGLLTDEQSARILGPQGGA